jgi:hypothetical protein
LSLCPETSTKNAVQEFQLRTLDVRKCVAVAYCMFHGVVLSEPTCVNHAQIIKKRKYSLSSACFLYSLYVMPITADRATKTEYS